MRSFLTLRSISNLLCGCFGAISDAIESCCLRSYNRINNHIGDKGRKEALESANKKSNVDVTATDDTEEKREMTPRGITQRATEELRQFMAENMKKR